MIFERKDRYQVCVWPMTLTWCQLPQSRMHLSLKKSLVQAHKMRSQIETAAFLNKLKNWSQFFRSWSFMSNVEQVRRRVQTYVYLSLSPTADKRGDAGELKCLLPFLKYRLGALESQWWLLSPSGDPGIGLVWDNQTWPDPTHFLVRVVKSSSNLLFPKLSFF